jgi:hypothetical protein
MDETDYFLKTYPQTRFDPVRTRLGVGFCQKIGAVMMTAWQPAVIYPRLSH